MLPGTIFEHDCSTRTKLRCEWRNDCPTTGDLQIALWRLESVGLYEPVKILLLQLKRIGDLILTTPAIAALRQSFPQAQLTLVVSQESADLLPAISNVDRILIARRNLRDLALFSSVATRRFDYCIDFTRNDRSASLALLSRARRRVVSYRVREQSKTRGHAYTDFVRVRMRDMHTIDYNLALLEPLRASHAPTAPRLDLPQIAYEKADALRHSWKLMRPYIILHPGSARQEKLWEPGRWADVIDYFDQNNGFDFVLTSGPSRDEQTHIAAIKNKAQQRITDLSGKTDLLTLAALISGARLLVTVDSAPVHLAGATCTPQVILFGPTNPFHWRPRESQAVILQGKSATPVTEFSPVQPRVPMSQISTEAVIGAMDSLLATHLATEPS
ncbi:MAG: putative lipopolysaccharide heptosyltransferase III [Verrucomicrobia bacterium]|nr:MAG: putative lipopolysaccharide heptosyltransferase III [Verrucomicrobiota bacterium]